MYVLEKCIFKFINFLVRSLPGVDKLYPALYTLLKKGGYTLLGTDFPFYHNCAILLPTCPRQKVMFFPLLVPHLLILFLLLLLFSLLLFVLLFLYILFCVLLLSLLLLLLLHWLKGHWVHIPEGSCYNHILRDCPLLYALGYTPQS